ncbi:vWA domain-containing protein [Eilatimonas milleporae]|nr:VWA-like domain-containing protein [Eilatimonas milleporae]
MERVTKARTRLLMSQPFFGVLALRLQIQEACDMDTMSTDGSSIFVNPDFVQQLSDDELIAVMAHEVMHCAHLHPYRREGRDLLLWNMACDYAINSILKESGFILPDGALLNQAYSGMSAEWIYADLLDKRDGQSPQSNSLDPGGCGAVTDPQESTGHEQTASDRKQKETAWKHAVIQAHQTAKASGRAPGGMDRLIRDIKKPKLDWRILLARFINARDHSDYSFSRPNPRFLHQDIFLPSLENQKLEELVIACDTSGSVSQEEIDQVNGELNAILQTVRPASVTVLHCDFEIKKVERFTPDSGTVTLEPVGFGGTDLRPPFDWCRENGVMPDAILYFSDLLSHQWPDVSPAPVLWITPNQRKAPIGETISLQYG